MRKKTSSRAARHPRDLASLALTSASGRRAAAVSTLHSDFAGAWWLPNLVLLAYPVPYLVAIGQPRPYAPRDEGSVIRH